MTKTRVNELLASESIATAATKTIDLNMVNPLSRIAIRVKGTNSSSTPTAHPAKIVSLIELVDGSDVLFSMSGVQAVGLNFVEMGELPFCIAEYENNIQVAQVYNLNFGRYLWDREWALDPKKFANLQLKITHNKAAGGSAPDAGTMAVFTYLFDDNPPSPRGFFMSKKHHEYTLTASGHEYIDLPTDYPYVQLYAQSYVDAVTVTSNINKVKWSIDNDRRVPLNNISMSEYIKITQFENKAQEDLATLGTASAVNHYITTTYENYGVGVGRSAASAGIIVGQPAGNRIALTSDTSESIAVRCTGYCPMGVIPLTFSNRIDPTSWEDLGSVKSSQLDITSGSGGSGAVAVLLTQARTY